MREIIKTGVEAHNKLNTTLIKKLKNRLDEYHSVEIGGGGGYTEKENLIWGKSSRNYVIQSTREKFEEISPDNDDYRYVLDIFCRSRHKNGRYNHYLFIAEVSEDHEMPIDPPFIELVDEEVKKVESSDLYQGISPGDRQELMLDVLVRNISTRFNVVKAIPESKIKE